MPKNSFVKLYIAQAVYDLAKCHDIIEQLICNCSLIVCENSHCQVEFQVPQYQLPVLFYVIQCEIFEDVP